MKGATGSDGRIWHPGDPVRPLREHLERGGVIAIPTESSYGLGALPANRSGVEAIYRLKGREAGKPLPVVVGDLRQLDSLGIDSGSETVERLARLWPAPLTAVLPTTRSLPASAGEASLAVRIPDHEVLRGLLLDLGEALTATSANLSGEPPVLDPMELTATLPGWDGWVVDGGRLPGGPPSTIVRWEGGSWRVIRPGRHPIENLEGVR